MYKRQVKKLVELNGINSGEVWMTNHPEVGGSHLPDITVITPVLKDNKPIFFVANGVLSAISDNVFVATIYINEIKDALDMNIISREQFDKLAIAINTGTNIPSIATPNGQAAFLFLLTSSLAPLINLSYMRMVVMALPYTIILSIVGFIAVVINL